MRLLPHFTLVMRKGQPEDEFKITEGFIPVLQWAKGGPLISISYLIKPRKTDKTGCCKRDHGILIFFPTNAHALCCNARHWFKTLQWSWWHWFGLSLSTDIFSNGSQASKPHFLIQSGSSLPSPEEKRRHCLGKPCPDPEPGHTAAVGLLARAGEAAQGHVGNTQHPHRL